jgi:hypothetical protein
MIRGSVKLGPLQKRSLYGVLCLLWASGVAWLLCQYTGGEIYVGSPPQTWSLKIHGAAAMAFLVVMGALLPVHARVAWNQKRNRMAGATLLGLNAFLTLTGWMLYYIGSDTSRPWISGLHWSIGLGLPLFIYLHIYFARRYPADKKS